MNQTRPLTVERGWTTHSEHECGTLSWPELVRWSEEPALLTYLRFGMHRGERFDAAPGDYLLWLAEGAHDLSEDVRFSARYWLDGRNGTQTG